MYNLPGGFLMNNLRLLRIVVSLAPACLGCSQSLPVQSAQERVETAAQQAALVMLSPNAPPDAVPGPSAPMVPDRPKTEFSCEEITRSASLTRDQQDCAIAKCMGFRQELKCAKLKLGSKKK
jgi:hypothetical protein